MPASFRPRLQKVGPSQKATPRLNAVGSRALPGFAHTTFSPGGDGATMMSRTQITLESEIQRRARQRASDLGVSFAEYVRRLVVRDLSLPNKKVDPSGLFDLGSSGGSDIAKGKNRMISEAFAGTSVRRRPGSR